MTRRRPGSETSSRTARTRVVAVVGAALAAGVLMYPSAADWFSDRAHATEINAYVRDVTSTPPEEIEAALRQARAYNEALPQGPLRDPYALDLDGRQTAIGDGVETYFATLDGEQGVMGRVNVPSIGVELPIYHGTDPEVLAKGAGHLFGSALPVGGESTHSVITAHSGFVNAALFTQLPQVELGEVFTVTVLDQVIAYEVDQILTVEPGETEELRVHDGEDHLTLITCTPIGVNSHRLLVRGTRTDDPSASLRSEALDPAHEWPGFPWWMLAVVGAPGGAFVLTRPRRPAPRRAQPARSARRRSQR